MARQIKYRIVPAGLNFYHVQWKLGPFWITVRRNEWKWEFMSVSAAREFIDQEIAEREVALAHQAQPPIYHP